MMILTALALAAAATPAPPPAKEDRMICRREAATGTRVAKRKCRSQAEMASAERKGQDTMRELQSMPRINPPENSTGR
jgi:hypothetical protein